MFIIGAPTIQTRGAKQQRIQLDTSIIILWSSPPRKCLQQLDEQSNFLSTQREDITHLLGSASDIEIITFYETMPVRPLGKVRINLLFT
jgi:hypothetical protein